MKPLALFCILVLAAMSLAQSPRSRKLLDFGWRFHLGDAADMTKDFGYGGGQTFAKAGEGAGPIRPNYDDSSWRKINVPHDWVVEEDFVHDDDSLYVQHGSKPTGRKFPGNVVGWYRRTFQIPSTDKGLRLSVEFDGVFRDSIAWLNGHLLGRHLSGYSSFAYDISDFVNYGGSNVLTVRVDASQYEGWFYEGAGIYRHVWLVKTSPVHIDHWGTFVSSQTKGDKTTLTLRTTVANDSGADKQVSVTSTIVSLSGTEIGTVTALGVSVGAWSKQTVTQKVIFNGAELWSLDHPMLYRWTSMLSIEGPFIDSVETPFGIRTIRFDSKNGFFLNGKHVEIKGTCNHQDHAGLGTALPDRLQYFRIEKLKEMGCNAIRTSHNPPTPELLDACDRLGMLVMDENRLLNSSDWGLGEVEDLVRRDRNHPSVILWSLCNEEPAQDTEIGKQIASTMIRRVRALDPTRPVTDAANNGTNYEGINSILDVRGVNYMAVGSPDEYHAAHPLQPMVGSEEASTLSTRGEYANDPARGYMTSYDTEKPSWGTTAEEWWTYYAARPYLAGAFVWTGFDYRGEPTPYGWPCISSHFGIMDTCGFPKDNYYYYQAWWSGQPVLHLLPHWNWQGKDGQPINVWCYSNQDEVELLLNGKSLGKKTMPQNGHLEWSVLYQAGTLEARGYVGGKVVKTEVVETTGSPARIVLTPDRTAINADGEDVAVFTVSVVDSEGRVVPEASNDIHLEADGGQIIGVGNGDPSSHERDKFVEAVETAPLTNWSMTALVSSTDPLALNAIWPRAKPADISDRASGMDENSFAAYRSTLNLTQEAIKDGVKLSIGQIDDSGLIYVNGKKIGETTDWDRSYSFDLADFVHPGENSVVVVVQNNGGPGGLGGGVSVSWTKPAGAWHRSVFHGLAQVIVQAGTKPGDIILRASSAGLKSAETTIRTKKAEFRGL